jgi:hypothetical protein
MLSLSAVSYPATADQIAVTSGVATDFQAQHRRQLDRRYKT